MRYGLMIALLALAGVGTAATRANAAAYTFTSFDVPGSGFAVGEGINNAGQVTGTYDDTAGRHSFVDTNGVIATFDVPGAIGNPLNSTGTAARGINTAGQVVGSYNDATGSHGFVDTNGVFTTLNVPSAQPGKTYATGINSAGQVTGSYLDASAVPHDFVETNGVYTTLVSPGPLGTEGDAINDAGQVTAFYVDATGNHSFDYATGTVSTIDVPGSLPGRSSPFAINNVGQVAGYYYDGTATPFHGFVETNGIFTTIDVPGASRTFIDGINDAGQVTGYYEVNTGNLVFHAFIASPTNIASVPEPASMALLASGLAGLSLITRRRRTA